jgi:ParB family chromosome partitioning protein
VRNCTGIKQQQIMTTPQIELIDSRLIDESPMNPRKFFNTESVRELSESISKQGLLQPITVRIYKDKKILQPASLAGKTCYEIICGARRYRASVLAGLETIPCIVREMTDEEAFDTMITENLQRKDVAPMDEGRAFFELHKREVSFEELAARFGKSVQFIRLRIKLNELVPGLVDLLEKKELQLTHALELCKLDPIEQLSIFEKHYGENKQSWADWSDRKVTEIKNKLQSSFSSLDGNQFDQTDCEMCQFRCGSNLLFEEYKENTCSNNNCFSDKVIKYQIELALQYNQQGYKMACRDSYNNEQSLSIIEELKSLGIEFLNWDDINVIHLSEDIDKKAIQDKQLESGALKMAYCIGVFSYNDVRCIEIKEGVVNNDSTESNEIPLLQSKDKRNSEIKKEKIIEDVRTLMTDSNFSSIDFPLTKIEVAAMYGFMLRDSSIPSGIQDTFNKELSYIENCKNLNTPTQNRIVRSFIRKQSIAGEVTYSENIQSIILSVSKESYPDETTRIELKHEDTYLKRKERIDEQIKSLS